MKVFFAVLLGLYCQAGLAAAEPAFYVVDLRHTGDAVLHLSARNVPPKTEFPYVVVDSSSMNCCFRIGTKPGARKFSIRSTKTRRL